MQTQAPKIDLKKIRRDNDWTQEELAKKLGIARSYVAMIEKTQRVSVNIMRKMIQKLGVTYEDFYKDSG